MSPNTSTLSRSWLHRADDNTLFRLLDEARRALTTATGRNDRERASRCLQRITDELKGRHGSV